MSLTKSEIKNKIVKNIIDETNNIFSNNKNIQKIKNENIQKYLIHLEKELLNILDNIIEKELKSFIGNDNALMIEHIINTQIDIIVNNSIQWYNNYESETVNKRIDENIDLFGDTIKDILIETIKKVCITKKNISNNEIAKHDNEIDNETNNEIDNETNNETDTQSNNEIKCEYLKSGDDDDDDDYDFLKNINTIEKTVDTQIKNELHLCNCVFYIFYSIYDSIHSYFVICKTNNSTIE
jgi:hypothetical protein